MKRVPAAACLLLLAGCSRSSIVGLHCEGGVKDTHREGAARYEALGGECLDVRADTKGDAAAIGSAVWVSDYTSTLVVRSTGKNTYSLHREGAQVGTLERDGNWLHVRFTSVPPGSKTMTERAYHVRSDSPGPLI